MPLRFYFELGELHMTPTQADGAIRVYWHPG